MMELQADIAGEATEEYDHKYLRCEEASMRASNKDHYHCERIVTFVTIELFVDEEGMRTDKVDR